MLVHDLIGIGFGPSNIALAIALEEEAQIGPTINALFIERQPSFAWHNDMLLEHASMQISFLKDLVTPRNPSSRFSFLRYLHEKKRLHDFINLKTFFPSRIEFNDYLFWAADQFSDCCVYGEDVLEVLPEERDGTVELLRVRSRDAKGAVRERLTRNLVVSPGGVPNIPRCFEALQDDERVFHSSRFLQSVARHRGASKVAVVGAGQSAAEIFLDLHDRLDVPRIDLLMRSRALKPSDDSPFVNEIYNPNFTDYVFASSPKERATVREEFACTNYAAPDLDVVERIYGVLYRQKVAARSAHRLVTRHEIEDAHAVSSGISLLLHDLDTGTRSRATYDAVVLATGYLRNSHERLLAPLHSLLGGFDVDRSYRLQGSPQLGPSIFLQGGCEATHGLSDTLLSVIAVRSGEICSALLRTLGKAAVELRPRPTVAMAHGASSLRTS